MAFVTPKMSLRVWNSANDIWDHQQLAANFVKLDQHDHTAGKGTQLPTGAIQNSAITNPKILDGAVTNTKLDTTVATWLGITGPAGTTRRGKSNITTPTESRTSTTYGTMPTPDQVTGVTLPTDGLLAVAFMGTWQESVNNAARAAIFIGANQLRGPGAVQEASLAATGGLTAIDRPLATSSAGLWSDNGAVAYTGDVATGQTVAGGNSFGVGGGGPVWIFAAAGTYTISVQFKSTSGSVTVKNRKLWVWTVGF